MSKRRQPEDVGAVQGGRDHPPGLPRRGGDHRRRARGRRRLAVPDRRRGRARGDHVERRRAAALQHGAARRLLRADRDRAHGRERRRREEHDADRPARAEAEGHPLREAGPRRHPAGPGAERRQRLRLRHRGRRRERAGRGEVLPRPLRAGHEDPAHRPAAGLRRQLAPQRVPRAGRVPRRRRRDDPAQRRHGQPRLDRRLEQAAGRAHGHPRLVRAAGRGHPRLGRRRLRERDAVGQRRRGRHPQLVRAAHDAALPGLRVRRHRQGDPEPHRAEHRGRLDDVHGPHAVLGRGARPRSSRSRRRTRT